MLVKSHVVASFFSRVTNWSRLSSWSCLSKVEPLVLDLDLRCVLVDTSFKSYDFACTNRDMLLCDKWNVFVPYDSKATGNVHKVAENVDSSIFSWILRGSKYFSECQMTYK